MSRRNVTGKGEMQSYPMSQDIAPPASVREKKGEQPMASDYAYSIDSNIPCPSRKWSYYKYPFPLMKVGDSFFIPASHLHTKGGISSTVSQAGKKLNRKFLQRKQPGGWRIWRVA